MRKIGYARVSSTAQNLDRQIGALRSERCDEIFREKASGKDVPSGSASGGLRVLPLLPKAHLLAAVN
jgi:DNA invertase Pin-like site-specific DNA recombinase